MNNYTTFFYDQQTRRFLIQFIRILSNFQVEVGKDQDNNSVLKRVPVFYGDPNRQASQILRNNSENSMQSVPAIAVYITGFEFDRERLQDPTFVSRVNVRERAYDEVNQVLTSRQGNTLTVERMMPVPWKLTIKADIWTSSTEQKFMLLEQIAVLFAPSFEIQNTDNYLDWTSLSTVLLTGSTFSSRTVPAGPEETIDIATLTFELPIWISAPAKVKKLGVIQKIIARVFDDSGGLDDGIADDGTLLSTQHFTFLNFGLTLQGNQVRLVKMSDTTEDNEIDSMLAGRRQYSWFEVIEVYGKLQNGISQLRLLQSNGSEVIGTVAYHPADSTILLFNAFNDTLPANTLPPVNAIINPQKVAVDSDLLNPAPGTRYLILSDIGAEGDEEGSPIWNRDGLVPLVAKANDIIQWDGRRWSVSFASQTINSVHYITNLNTGTQYKWQDGQWTKSLEGRYNSGEWSLVL